MNRAAAAGVEPVRALAALMPCGVLLLEGDAAPVTASAQACALLGVAGEAELRTRWDALAAALGLDAPGALPLVGQPRCTSRELHVAGALHALRLEIHATGTAEQAQYLVLLKRRDRLDDADAALVAAAGADVQQRVLAGLLHDLNAPLNNLSLTLALLDGALARIAAQRPDDPALTRCRRYVDALKGEAKRLSECALAMGHAAGQPEASTDAPFVSALLHDVHHALRHHAMLHELRVSLAAPGADLPVAGDVGLLRLALLDLMLTAIDATAPGGEIVVEAHANRDDVRLRIAARAAQVPADAQRMSQGVLVAPGAPWLGFVAARLILGVLGGSAALRAEAHDTLVIDARLPAGRR